jgi:CheY-like chemotaxis protein
MIIAISGYNKGEDRHRYVKAKFDHHLIKPVDFDALFALLT